MPDSRQQAAAGLAAAAPNGASTGDRLLTAQEVQSHLGMSRAKVYRLMQDNVLPTVRIGGSVRVPMNALARWIEENTCPGRKITGATY